jgi:hypothetical protein
MATGPWLYPCPPAAAAASGEDLICPPAVLKVLRFDHLVASPATECACTASIISRTPVICAEVGIAMAAALRWHPQTVRPVTRRLPFTGEPMPAKIRSDVTVQPVGDEMLVLDLKSEQIHQLNATAAWILKRCDGINSIEVIRDQFAEHFCVDGETAARDVAGAIGQLSQLGVLDLD